MARMGGNSGGKGRFGKKDGRKKGNALFRRRKFCRFTADKVEQIDFRETKIVKLPWKLSRQFCLLILI